MAQNLKLLREDDFKGYNDKDKPENLPPGFCADILNGFVEENKLIKRSGYSKIGNTPVSKPILGQQRHEPSGGSKYILRARNNSGDTNAVVEGWSGSGDWVALTGASSQTADAEHEFVMASNATYIFNGSNTVLKTTNGTSTSTVAGIPIGKDARWFHNFLFVFGVTGNRSRLYFSDVNTPETFDSVNGWIDINPGDNEEITALAVLKDELLIFKNNRVWSLTGFGVSDFTLQDLGERLTGVGTIARRSIVETGNDVYYLSFQGGVAHFRSIQRTKFGQLVDGGIISDNITGTMKRMVTTRLGQTAGIFDGRKVWWSIVSGVSTTNNEVVVYDTLSRAWVRLTGINANVFHISTLTSKIQIYFGESGNNANSYIFDTSTNDNGSAIDFKVITRMYNPAPGRKCRYKYLYLTGDIETDVDIDVDYSPDGFTLADLGTIMLTGSGAVFGSAIFGSSKFGATSVARDRLDFAGGQAYYMQYQFRNSVLDEDVAIREWEIFYQEKAIRGIN